MTENTKIKWLNGKNLVTFVIGLIIAYLAISIIINQQFSLIEDNTRSLINEQQALIVAISEATSRNGADRVTESIISNCTIEERSNFNELLNNIDSGLNISQLNNLDRLFARCGSFNSERKALMSARLTREVEVYGDYIEQLNIITDTDHNEEFDLDRWRELSSREARQSELFSRLVDLQDQIITELRSGTSATSPKISEILIQVNSTQDSLAVATAQASELRNSLTDF